MKLLITGDIHGRSDILQKVLKDNSDIDLHLNTGDLELDEEIIIKSKMIAVKGNTDYKSSLPEVRYINIDNLKILLTHGHLYGVKQGIKELVEYAKANSVDICIFGHTHEAFDQVISGIRFINPGHLSGYKGKTYAVYEDGKVNFINAD